jgi:hypothetical protein
MRRQGGRLRRLILVDHTITVINLSQKFGISWNFSLSLPNTSTFACITPKERGYPLLLSGLLYYIKGFPSLITRWRMIALASK